MTKTSKPVDGGLGTFPTIDKLSSSSDLHSTFHANTSFPLSFCDPTWVPSKGCLRVLHMIVLGVSKQTRFPRAHFGFPGPSPDSSASHQAGRALGLWPCPALRREWQAALVPRHPEKPKCATKNKQTNKGVTGLELEMDRWV